MPNLAKKNIAISIPTGIGADIGGYAGDFGYIARKFSRYFHTVINPNAVNGGIFSAINNDMSYLEGYLFDEFFEGKISITPKKPYEQNKIGIIFESVIPKNVLNIHLNTLSALEMVKGIKTQEIIYTKKEVGVEIKIENGISYGNLKNPKTLLDAADNLVKKGIEAIAVVCYFDEDTEDEDYSNGIGIDPIGGVEAIISHLITKNFKIPCAHSPAFLNYDISEHVENKKVSSEMISSTYLPCIMEALSIAPKINDYKNGLIKNKDIEYLIVPTTAMGSKSVLAADKNNIKIIAVDNNTVCDADYKKLNIEPFAHFKTYEECLENII